MNSAVKSPSIMRKICLYSTITGAIALWLLDMAFLLLFHRRLFPGYGAVSIFALLSIAAFLLAGTVAFLIEIIVACLANLISSALRALFRKISPNGLGISAISYTAISSLWIVYVSYRLFQGAGISQKTVSVYGPYIVAPILILFCYPITRQVIVLLRSSTRNGFWLIPIGFLSLILFSADAYLYVDLYNYLHVTLAILTFLSLQLFFTLILQNRVSDRTYTTTPSTIFRNLLILCAACIAVLYLLGGRNQLLKNIAYRRSVNQMKILNAFSSFSPGRELKGYASRYRFAPHKPPQDQRWFGRCKDMNLIFIVLDAVRADHLSIYGYDRETCPFLAKLAEESIVFNNYYCQSATYSKQAMAGTFTSHYGELLFSNARMIMPTLGSHLLQNDYRTARLVMQDDSLLGHNLLHIGFQTDIEQSYSKDSLSSLSAGDRSVAMLIDFIKDHRDEKFFIWVQPFAAHAPYRPPDRFRVFGNRQVDLYDGDILHLDSFIKKFMEELNSLGLLNDTLIVITADHGEQFREHGGVFHGSSLYNEEMHLPLLILYPGCSPKIIDKTAGHTDLLPTIATMLGIRLDHKAVGKDLTPIIFGAEGWDERPLVAYSVRARQWVLIKGHYKLIYSVLGDYYELYDLENDPGEKNNLIYRNAGIANKMKETLSAARIEILEERTGRLVEGKDCSELLRILRESEDPYKKAAAVRTIAIVDQCEAFEVTTKALQDEQVPIRRAAAWALGRTKDRRAVPLLLHSLENDTDYIVRLLCIESLGRVGSKEAAPILNRLLAKEDLDLGTERIANQAVEMINR